jgi:ankyrin repeat protein
MDIFTSARAGLLEEVRYFTEVEQVELNQTDFFNATPLYYACLGGHPEVVQYLLSAGGYFSQN